MGESAIGEQAICEGPGALPVEGVDVVIDQNILTGGLCRMSGGLE